MSAAAAALLVAMLLVMWAQSSPAGCTSSPEASRRLVLSRQIDREHLARDLASVDRIARRYMAAKPGDDQPRRRFLDCEAMLLQEIDTRHGVLSRRTSADGP